MNARILLVEDEPGLVLILTDLLTAEGYQVAAVNDGKSGLAKALSAPFDLVILDVMLPQMNGLDVCKELRQRGRDVAILMLTAKTQLVDRVVGLKLGADDYLTKPFEPPELLARVEALLRRANKGSLVPVVRFQFGNVDADFETGYVERSGSRISLAAKEMELLRFLIDHRGRTVSREELLEGVWQYQPGVSSRTIDVHVAWLRQKLEEDPELPRYIKTVRGVGYRFAP